ncbi:aspartic protease precursor [Aphelenchoides avenae]|nr:aspartic protease precursor [Aphelenchus avenae]
MAIQPSHFLVVFVSFCLAPHYADSKGVQLTLTSSAVHQRLPAPVSTGSFGWETLQLDVALGTPGQAFNLSIDYGSSTIVVFAEGYNQTFDFCQGIWASRHTFSKSNSSTFGTRGSQIILELDEPFGDGKDCGENGWSNGNLVTDHLTIGTTNAPNVSFGLMYSLQHLNMKWASDGIFGLGVDLNCISDTENCTTVRYLKAFGDPVVGVRLPGVSGSSGSISFGSLDVPGCSGNWQWVPHAVPMHPLSSDQAWTVRVKAVDLGSYRSEESNLPGVLTSLSSFILAPSDDFKKIISVLDAEYSFKNDEYTVECSKVTSLPTMNFAIDTFVHAVSATLYTQPVSS